MHQYSGNSNWFNQVHVEITKKGIAIYPPFIKRYLSSFLIPWKDVKIEGKVFKDAMKKLQFNSFARLQFNILNTDITLAISYRHKTSIEEMYNGYQSIE